MGGGQKMKKIITYLIFVISVVMNVEIVCATSTNSVNSVMDIADSLNIEEYSTVIDKNIENIGFSFSEFLSDFITGEFTDITIIEILSYLQNIVFQKVSINSNMIKNIILIALLSSFLKVLTENFENKGVSEIGFYTCYIVVAVILINSFGIVIGILSETVATTSNIITATIPMITALLIMAGSSGSSAVFGSFILMSITFLTFFIEKLFVPLMTSAVILNIVNYITPKEVLTKMVEFLKWLLTSSLKTIAVIFGAIVSLQRIASPVLNATTSKTAKTFVSFIPVVGDAMNNAIDGMMYFVGILKSGVSVAIFITLVLCALLPIVELVIFIFLYKITAVVIEPISDSRITSCVDSLGEYTKIILSALVVFIFLFIFFIAVMLTMTS